LVERLWSSGKLFDTPPTEGFMGMEGGGA